MNKQRLILPTIILALAVALWLVGESEIVWLMMSYPELAHLDVNLGLATAVWLASGFFLTRLTDILILQGWLAPRAAAGAPQIVRTVVAVVIWALIAMGILSIVYGQSITGLVTASSIVIAVVGFAVRSLIADLFYGMALAAESPFKLGDWLRLDDGLEGEVIEMNWRATRLQTRAKLGVVIPNSILATSRFENFNQPEPYFRETFDVRLGYDITSHQAERILLSAVNQVPEAAALPEPIEIRVKELEPDGVLWEVRFWVPDRPSRTYVRNKIQRMLLRNLHFAGVEVARDRAEMIVETARQAEARAPVSAENWLARIDVFFALDDDETEELRRRAKLGLCKTGEPIVSEGDAGSSMYFLIEGSLSVEVAGDNGNQIQVGQLKPGQFFGEMSLLTGEPRTATVIPDVDSRVYEITKTDLIPVLDRRPELARAISTVLADRHIATENVLGQQTETPTPEDPENLANQFVARIRTFFDIGFLKSLREDRSFISSETPADDFMNAAMAAAAFVTVADGDIDPRERAVVEGVFMSLDIFNRLDEKAGIAIYNRYIEEFMGQLGPAKAAVSDLLQPIVQDSTSGRVIVRLCCAISEADNTIMDPERTAIRYICNLLRLPAREFGVD